MRSSLLLTLLLAACTSAPGSPSIELYDPLGLADVTSELRLLVFPSDARSCTADGSLAPSLGDDMGAMFPGSVVDLRLPVGEAATVNLDPGTYVVSVRGWGTDPVTMRTNVLVARGCVGDVVIASGETREIDLSVQSVEGMGMCGDGLLSPDEQCEMATGPLPCNASCQTESQIGHTTVEGPQTGVSLAWATGTRMMLAFETTDPDEMRAMLRDETGQVITSPAAFAVDRLLANPPGVQTGVSVAASPARFGASLGHVGAPAMTGGGDIRVRFFDSDLTALGAEIVASPGAEGEQLNPSMAMLTDGTALVVFTDDAAGSGVGGSLFGPGEMAFDEVIFGTSGGAAPHVAAAGTKFAVAFESADGVRAEQLDASGVSMGPSVMLDAAGGAQRTPVVGGLPDGRFLVAWARDGQIRARAFDAAGSPLEAIDIGPGEHPAIAAGAGRYIVAWASGGEVRARYLDGSGALAENRESPRTREPFTVASGSAPVAAVGGSGTTLAGIAYEAAGDISLRLLPLP